jgi:hypothetical protein
MSFDSVFKNHVAPRLAGFYGGPVVYQHPVGSSTEGVDLEYVIVGDVRREKRQREYGYDIVEIRSFQMITDIESSRWCGIESVVIGGRLMVGNGEDCKEWPIKDQPTTESDGFTNVECERHLRHEIGNVKARG